MKTLQMKQGTIKGMIILLMVFCFISKGQVLFNKRIKTYNGIGAAYSVLIKGTDFFIYGGKDYNYGTSWNARYLMVKTDSLGDTVYTKSYGKIKYDYYSGNSGSATTFKGRYYNFGTRQDSVLSYSQYVLYKLAGNGDTVATKIFGDTSNFSGGYHTKISKKGDLILAGASDSLDNKWDFSLIKMDTVLNVKFKKYFGLLLYYEAAVAVDTCKDGGFIMGGWRQIGSNYIIYVVKTDSLGNLQWQNTYGNSQGSGIFTCKKQGYIITATYQDSVISGYEFSRTNLIKINNAGVVVWDKKYASASYGQFPAISYELANGNILTCGQIGHNNNPPVNGNSWGTYGFIMKTDSSGNVVFYQTYEATSDKGALNYLRDIKQTPDGGYVAVGFVQPSDGTSQDVWILKVDSNGCEVPGCPLNTDVQQYINIKVELTAYPNPTTGELNINYGINDPTCNEATLLLMELGSGKVLIKKTVLCSSTQTTLDLKELPSGIFALSIQSNGTSPKTIRIVKVQ